jgi:hypothetical protein
VSSTYYDLKHIRASLEVFIESLGFDAVLFEKGDIAFHPDAPLDESCYREASTADIFVLIIGGRYGSAASTSDARDHAEFYEKYESITRKEFEAAQEADVPTFILVDSAVSAEYRTYLKNRDNDRVIYAHVDSAGIFRLLETIFERVRNNPVFNFDRATQIEAWLREQWAGLFRELLRARSQQRQLAALNAQVMDLKSVNETLKTYLEAVLNKVNPDQSDEIIKDEEARLREQRRLIDLRDNPFYSFLRRRDLSDEMARSIIIEPVNATAALKAMKDTIEDPVVSDILGALASAQRDYNAARVALGVPELKFPKESSRIEEDEEGGSRATRKRPTLRRKPNVAPDD